MIIAIIFLFIISFSAYAVMWTLQFHFYNSVFRKLNNYFWDPSLSWKNKWKVVEGVVKVDSNGEEIERFWGSSRYFVATTDAFHLFQFIFLNSLILAISLIADGKVFYNYQVHWYESFIGIRLIYAGVFNLLFGWLLIKK